MGNSANSLVKLALYGDSLACPRIGVVDSDQRYIALLDSYLRKKKNPSYMEIRDRARGGIVLPELHSIYLEDNTYYNLPGDYLILHAGIVDCAPRPVEEHFKEKINKLPSLVKKLVIRYIHTNRARLIRKNNGGFVKTNPHKFKSTLELFLTHAALNYKKVFVINICPTNDEIEKHSPGFKKNIGQYNELIRGSLDSLALTNIILIDIYNELAEKSNIDDYIVKKDGHHIHPATHKIIADKIISFLNE